MSSSDKPASGTLGRTRPSLQKVQVKHNQPSLITEKDAHFCSLLSERGLTQVNGARVHWSQKHDQMTHSSRARLSGPFSHL